ncbi:type II toxin-antitoxin system VapC family toxin [Glycomyces tenuis]|uniref:type II toxin-antitoxin system VapC family toxin n=1 Tax=Glycomyces tenuis TaxID=58116 RepID=UPI0003FD5A1A|nr:type II toxin-antitoxin system VapC family toxin [Glycomyces tenuis]
MTVVDASVVVRLLLARTEDAKLREQFDNRARILHAPNHLDLEVISAVVGMLKGSKLTEDRAREMVASYRLLRIKRHDIAFLGGRLVTLRHNFTVYDAAYIALAEQLRMPLLTSDAKFARAPANCHSAEIQTFPA